jgi:hypothetical protein
MSSVAGKALEERGDRELDVTKGAVGKRGRERVGVVPVERVDVGGDALDVRVGANRGQSVGGRRARARRRCVGVGVSDA